MSDLNIAISPEVAGILAQLTQARGTVYIVSASDDTIEVVCRVEDASHPDGVTTYSIVLEEDGDCLSAIDLDARTE